MRTRNKWFYIKIGLLLLAIVSYNIWSYCAGHCTTTSLLAFSLPAKLLTVSIVVAFMVLMVYRNKNRQSTLHNTCSCGSALRNQWDYCPVCGQPRKQVQ